MIVTFIKKIWREPLVHFLLIGAALFVFYEQTREPVRMVFKALAVSSLLVLAGCGWMAEQALDHAAGFPASDVILDVKETSDEYEQEKHEERVEELNKDYEEFLRSRDAVGTEDEATEQSVVIQQQNDNND